MNSEKHLRDRVIDSLTKRMAKGGKVVPLIQAALDHADVPLEKTTYYHRAALTSYAETNKLIKSNTEYELGLTSLPINAERLEETLVVTHLGLNVGNSADGPKVDTYGAAAPGQIRNGNLVISQGGKPLSTVPVNFIHNPNTPIEVIDDMVEIDHFPILLKGEKLQIELQSVEAASPAFPANLNIEINFGVYKLGS